MKKKKPNKLKVLKAELVETKEALKLEVKEKVALKDILNQIHDILVGDSFSYRDRILFKNLPLKIAELSIYRKMYEGRHDPMQDVVNHQREIIRWLIKPSTADNAKELEKFKKITGESL